MDGAWWPNPFLTCYVFYTKLGQRCRLNSQRGQLGHPLHTPEAALYMYAFGRVWHAMDHGGNMEDHGPRRQHGRPWTTEATWKTMDHRGYMEGLNCCESNLWNLHLT